LKASNLLFDHTRDEALCLVDLDTMQHSNVAIEMGDALRSWTNPKGENHARGEVDLQLFEAALTGYLKETRIWLTEDEKLGLAHGLEVIALELSARFCADVFHDSYFGWDSTRYASRRAHNLVRAQSQVSLAQSARGLRGEMEALVRRLGHA
jgi:Ser/Thr protein kinase RdoA (MazF antagonist)